jgi:hypothetical protein
MAEILTFASVGLTEALKAAVGGGPANLNWVCHLATALNGTTSQVPSFTDTVSLYTESTETGYSPFTLMPASYVFSVSSPNVIATYPNFGFTFTEQFATVYYVFVTDSSGSILIGGDKLATPNVSGSAGGTININGLAFALS